MKTLFRALWFCSHAANVTNIRPQQAKKWRNSAPGWEWRKLGQSIIGDGTQFLQNNLLFITAAIKNRYSVWKHQCISPQQSNVSGIRAQHLVWSCENKMAIVCKQRRKDEVPTIEHIYFQIGRAFLLSLKRTDKFLPILNVLHQFRSQNVLLKFIIWSSKFGRCEDRTTIEPVRLETNPENS